MLVSMKVLNHFLPFGYRKEMQFAFFFFNVYVVVDSTCTCQSTPTVSCYGVFAPNMSFDTVFTVILDFAAAFLFKLMLFFGMVK